MLARARERRGMAAPPTLLSVAAGQAHGLVANGAPALQRLVEALALKALHTLQRLFGTCEEVKSW